MDSLLKERFERTLLSIALVKYCWNEEVFLATCIRAGSIPRYQLDSLTKILAYKEYVSEGVHGSL